MLDGMYRGVHIYYYENKLHFKLENEIFSYASQISFFNNVFLYYITGSNQDRPAIARKPTTGPHRDPQKPKPNPKPAHL